MSTYPNRLQPALQILQYIMCCLVLTPKVVMDDAYVGGRSENNIKCIVHDDLGWKNQTTRYNNCRFSAGSLALRVIFSVS